MSAPTGGLPSQASSLSLRQPGALETLDRALFALRSGPFTRVWGGWLAGLPLAAVCLALYYLEEIEHISSLRPLFALLLVLAFAARAVALSSLAEELVHELRPGLPRLGVEPAWPRITSLSALAAFGLWAWLWPLSWLAQLSPFAVAALIPLLALRGGIAPSWLARARCGAEGGLRGWGLASDDAAGSRAALVFVELLLLVGSAGLFANLYALTALALMLLNSVLGLDVAFVSAFLSTDNEFVAYTVLALALMVLDPLRASVSACVFADARGRRDGADLHAAVDALLSGSTPAERRRRATAAASGVLSALLGLTLVLSAAPGSADDRGADSPQPSDAASDRSTDPADAAARRAIEDILARREFATPVHPQGRTLQDWLREQLERLFEPTPEEPEPKSSLRIQLPYVSPWLVMTVVFGVLVLAALYVSWDVRRKRRATPPATQALSPAVTERAAPLWISEARELAARGDYAGALRALYAATLGTLDQARLIRFDPAKTNGQYLRAMPEGTPRELFGAFTGIFDRKWYGRELTSRADYEQSLALAERICELERPGP